MPVMLDAGGIESWLGGGAPVVSAEIDEAVKVVPVSPKIISPRHNEPDCVAPLVG
jgi:hypothetical protein